MLGFPGGLQTGADGFMNDPLTDQQTGQPQSDFASASAGSTNSGFLIQFGQIGGVDYLGFRVMLNEFKAVSQLVNIRVGMDANADGKMDIYLGPNGQNTDNGLIFQGTGAGLNTSPNTSTIGTVFYPPSASGGSLPFSATNFSNIEISAANTATFYPGWTIADEDVGDNKAAQNDAMVSFAYPLAAINDALERADDGLINNSFADIGPNTFIRWLAFTATQNNAINQDVYGLAKITQSNGLGDTPYTSFLPLMNSFGQPVPEPATYGLVFGVGLAGLCGLRRRRRPAISCTA